MNITDVKSKVSIVIKCTCDNEITTKSTYFNPPSTLEIYKRKIFRDKIKKKSINIIFFVPFCPDCFIAHLPKFYAL